MATNEGRVVWHECVTTDVDAAKAFYAELLGWEIETWKPGELDYPMITVDGQGHGGFGAAPDGVPSHWLGHVHVADVDAAVERATGHGATVLFGPMDVPEVGRFCVISDPQGAVCSLYTPAGDAPTAQGVFVWDELIVDDVDAAKAFYGDVVDWTTSEMDMSTGPYTLFHAGDQQIGGLMRRPEGMPGPPAVWMTYLGTADADATAAKAAELGGAILGQPFDVPTIGRIAVIADPTGAVIGIFTPTTP